MALPGALWAYRTAVKEGTQFSPYHLIYGKEAMLPLEVEIPALQMLMKLEDKPNQMYEHRLLDLQEAQLDRLRAAEYYAKVQERNQERVNRKFRDKDIGVGDLVLRYNSQLDHTFKTRFVTKWEGPFKVREKFANGSYQLEDLDGMVHERRVNGVKLKKYFVRIMQVSTCGPVVWKSKKPEDLLDEDVSEELRFLFQSQLRHECL